LSQFGWLRPTIANYDLFCKEKREGQAPPFDLN
jgi:hypothetical protein